MNPSAAALITTPPTFLNHELPAWWTTGQQAAWQLYLDLPQPHGKNEAWRFATTSKLALETYRLPLPPTEAAETAVFNHSVGAYVFANDHLLVEIPLADELMQKGVIICPLSVALKTHPDLVQRFFMKEACTLGGTKYAALHRAHLRDGMFVFIPPGLEIHQPIEIDYWLTDGEAAIFPHNLVVAEPHSKIDLRFYYRSTPGVRGGFLCGMSDFHVGTGAQVRHVHVQNLNTAALAIQLSNTVVHRDAQAVSLHLNLGGAYARMENKSRLIGAGGRSEMLSLTAGEGTQEFDQRTFQEHAAPHTVSDLLYKNALADDSRTIFAGMIDVDPQAQQTNAYQSNRNLLLSDTAEANSLPGLEIMANDVRCTHGATSGQINDEELFYLRQRGIPLPVAKKLFVLGFFDEVIARLKDPALGEELHRLIEAKFAA
jgi:Fe-S cluster assembly protein SufD